jgi:peptidoglycan/xylan/chitin deacetylase (PgdA/CDA1 family)
MKLSRIHERMKGCYQTVLANMLFRRSFAMGNAVPYISFTFDDFPRSALEVGGSILLRHGLRATYYVSFGQVGETSDSGLLFTQDDIRMLIAQGHELGCHTYGHCHSRDTDPAEFEASILKNRQVLDAYVPGSAFRSFSYPIVGPLADTKRRAGKYFRSCRAGGQTYNAGKTDLNLLKAFFLEKKRGDPGYVREIIERNSEERGWLIFATHDIDDHPSPYGCTPAFFENIVAHSLESGARILPVDEVLDQLYKDKPAG